MAGNKNSGRRKGHRSAIDIIGNKKRVAILLRHADQAAEGDHRSAELILSRTDPTLSRAELGGHDGKPIALEHAEAVAAEMPTDVLRELDALAERMNGQRGNGAAPNGSGVEH